MEMGQWRETAIMSCIPIRGRGELRLLMQQTDTAAGMESTVRDLGANAVLNNGS